MGSAERAQWNFPANEKGKVLGWEPTAGKHLVNVNLPTFDVKQFGAEGNGVTDDTAAITAALARLTSGGVLFFPAGTYLISSTIDTLSNVTFAGAGMGASIILADAADFNMIEVQDGQSDIAFRDLTIKGTAASDATAQYGIYAAPGDAATRVSIERCRFTQSNNAVSVGAGIDWKIAYNYFDNLVGVISGTGYGVLCAAGQYCIMHGNTYVGSSGKGRHAFYLSNASLKCQVTDNIIRECNECAIITVAFTAQTGVVGHRISGNLIDGGGTTGTTDSPAIFVGGKASDILVEGNTIMGFDNDAILVTDHGQGGACLRTAVRGNKIHSPYARGVVVMGAKSTRVLGNDISNASSGSSGANAAISIRSTGSFGSEVCDNTVIAGNAVDGSTHRVALQIINGSPVPTNTRIGANSFLAGATASKAIELNGVDVKFVGNLTDGRYTYGSDDVNREIPRRTNVNFGSISAGAIGTATVTVTGVTTTGWSVEVTYEGALESGLVPGQNRVSAADTVTLSLYNTTGSPIDPALINVMIVCRRLNT